MALGVKRLFDNSEKFEISLVDETVGQIIWPVVYPRWQPGKPSGVENSLEVVVVRRLVSIAGITIENVIENVAHLTAGGEQYWKLFFTVKRQRDLDSRDWYILMVRHDNLENNVAANFKLLVNTEKANELQIQPPRGYQPLKMHWHGTDIPPQEPNEYEEQFNQKLAWGENLHPGQNYIKFRVVGPPNYEIDVYIISVPRCTPIEYLGVPPFATLEVKLWK